MIDEKLTLDLLAAVEQHCNTQLANLNPALGGQEAYDHGSYTGVKIMIKRLRIAIEMGELNPRDGNKIRAGAAQVVMGKDRKVFIMEEEKEHDTSQAG